jgi:lysozyme
MQVTEALLDFVKVGEGWSGLPYKCTSGKWTIGWGHNMEARGIPSYIEKQVSRHIPIRREQGDQMLREELKECIHHAEKLVSTFSTLDAARQVVIVDMIFNLGAVGFSCFGPTIEHINKREWGEVVQHLEGSKWYKQVKSRAKRNCRILQTGVLE